MPLGNYAEMLMYTPFLSIYGVPDNIHEKLTYDAFFGENGCYIKADFDKKIQTLIEKAKHSVNNNMTGDDWSVSVNEVLDALRRGKNDELELNRWIEESNDGIFTILGDAGTGKSTFLHYLQWEKKNIQWHILDLKNAIPEIEIFGSSVTIPREYFKSLHGKVASAIILEIFNLLFVKKNDKVNLEESKKNLQELLCRYDLYIANEFPLELYDELYKSLLEVQNNSHNDIDYFRRCARIITKYFNETCFGKQRNRDTEAAALRCTLTHLLIVLRCLEEKRCKKLIVFDNIERFIGIDEIYNKELTDFLNDMRNYCDIYKSKYFITKTNTNLFAKNYQFIVSMRNTTVRNHVPAENGDFTRHSIDLSNWFSIGDIIHKKLDWYEKHDIEVLDKFSQMHLEYILGDEGILDGRTLRGLQPKLDLVFNYNKRNITVFLVHKLLKNQDDDQEHYLKAADFYYNSLQTGGATAWCAQFGYRSVVWRKLLDLIRQSPLIQDGILSQYREESGRISCINYIWKILVVLHRFSIAHGGSETDSRGTEQYMPFLDLIQKVYNESDDFSSLFYEDGFYLERLRMARLLFYLNYFNREKKSWFYYIDIQYNAQQANRRNLERWEVLYDMFFEARNTPETLGIRITTAGKAYVGYIAPSFEFISCIAGKFPLLCCLPTEEELLNYKAEDQVCMQIIRSTVQRIQNYISDSLLHTDNSNLLYHREANNAGQTYAERIVNSASGYLGNFTDCISRLVSVSSKRADKTKNDLIQLILSEVRNLTDNY